MVDNQTLAAVRPGRWSTRVRHEQWSAAVRHWRWSVAVIAAVGWGIIAACWTPRGPVTPAQALWSVGLSLAVGGVAGWLTRARWSMLVAPAAFVVALELTRWKVPGPSVDLIHLNVFGVAALLAGRGVHGLLSVLPMLVAAGYAAAIARRGHPASARYGQPASARYGQPAGGSPWGRRLRRAGAGVLAAIVVVVTVAFGWPATTPPIVDADGRPVANSVAELGSVDVGERRLGLMIRGYDTSLPVLLFLPGAPGGSEIGSMRRHLAELERHFVVATLDRRGAGRSYGALDPTSTMTLDSAVADTIAVTEHLRQRFGQEKIFLLAHSGGSLIGVLAAQRRPELFRAYIGTGQAVHLPTTDRIFYDDILAWAATTDRTALVDRLTELGPPPYPDFYSYEPIISNENGVYAYDRGGNDEGPDGSLENINVPEYTLLDKVHTLNTFMDTFTVLYPRMLDVDLRTDVRRLEIPVYFIQGAHEMRGLAEPFAEWYALLDAPAKHLTTLDTSGHRAMFEQPTEFVNVLADLAR